MSTRLDAVLRANPMALPMHLRSAEVALNNSTLLSVEKRGPDALRAEATFIRQQLALHASYVNACGNIEAFSDAMRGSTAHLVPLRFPIRLTQKTRECVEDGMFRSFLRFLQDLHGLVLEQQEGGVDDAVTGVDAFLTRLANVLTLESCRVLDGIVHICEARNVCVSYIEKCQLEVVRKESTELLGLDDACSVVVECRFGTSVARIGKNVAVRMRAFLKTAERKGLSVAACRLERERQLRDVVEKHSWLRGGAFDDARIERVYELLAATHSELAQELMWQRRRIAWLASANAANRCWCGLATSTGVEGALVHAPAHMRSFVGGERVRVGIEAQEVPFVCYLSAASVANTVLELLREHRLPLNRISAAYATRIMTFDFW
jgi:hypothetical protein